MRERERGGDLSLPPSLLSLPGRGREREREREREIYIYIEREGWRDGVRERERSLYHCTGSRPGGEILVALRLAWVERWSVVLV